MYWKSHCYWGGSGNPTEVCWVDADWKKHEDSSRGCDDVLVLDLNAGHLWKEVHTVNYMVKLGIHPFMSFLLLQWQDRRTNLGVSLLQTPLLLSLLPPTERAWLLPHQLMTAFPCEDTRCGKGGWARNQVFFFFFLDRILHQPSLGRSQQMSECDFSWDYWIIGQVCFRPHFMQDWGAFVITDIYVCFLFHLFLFSFKENSTLSMHNWHTQYV